MSKFNTDKVREELESDVWGARELQSQLRKTLDEIDKLEDEKAAITIDKSKVEQHTKDAIWTKIQRDAGSCLYISLTQAREAIEQAMDSVGGK